MGAVTGGIGGMLGLNGGVNGTGFSGPKSADLINTVTPDQLKQSQDQSQAALAQQTAFLQAVQAQNGLGNQTNVFNQLQGVANGTGPNPAQAQLAQATGANTANQAALMAGQRGAGGNAGMIARQAAQQGAANQQNAAGQAASMQAQQSLGALNQMGGMANQMAGQQAQATTANTQAAQNQQSNLLNAAGNVNNARVGNQSNINNNNQQMTNQALQGQQQFTGNMMNAAGSALMLADGGKVPQLHETVPQFNLFAEGGSVGDLSVPQSRMGKFLTGYQESAMRNAPKQDALGQGASKLGTAIGQGIKGLFSPNVDSSLMDTPMSQPTVDPMTQSGPMMAANGGGVDAPQMIQPEQVQQPAPAGGGKEGGGIDPAQLAKLGAMFMAANGGKVPAMVSPGEKVLSPEEAAAAKAGKINPMAAGKQVPGKPKVGGAKNDYANDTVPASLEEGSLVLPRSVTQAKNPHWAALRFVQQHFANGGKVCAMPKAPKKSPKGKK